MIRRNESHFFLRHLCFFKRHHLGHHLDGRLDDVHGERTARSFPQAHAHKARIVDAGTAADLADFVIVIYNPKSEKRNWQVGEARNIIMAHRDPDAPVGIVTGTKRENQEVRFVPLQALSETPVGVQTTLFVGSLRSTRETQNRKATEGW